MNPFTFKKTVNFGRELEVLEARLNKSHGETYYLTQIRPLYYRFLPMDHDIVLQVERDQSSLIPMRSSLYAQITQSPGAHIKVHFTSKVHSFFFISLFLSLLIFCIAGYLIYQEEGMSKGIWVMGIICLLIPIYIQFLIRLQENALFERVVYSMRLPAKGEK